MSDDLNEVSKTLAVLHSQFEGHVKQDELYFSHIIEATKEVRLDLKKQTWFLALIIGGFIAVSKLPELFDVVHKAGAATP